MADAGWEELEDGARRRLLARAIGAVDFMRRPPPLHTGVRKHKEWEHFVVLTPELELLVNFSCCDDPRPGAGGAAEFPRVIVLTRTDGWDGDVETFAPEAVRIRPGSIDLRMGPNRLWFEDGCYRIQVALADRPIAMDLRLEPRTIPVFVPRIKMIEGPLLNWTVVPRLDAYGTLDVAGRRFELAGAPAYHDHNWGPFFWGHDCAWEWGFVLPDDPAVRWGITFVRLSDRARTHAIAQSTLLWKEEKIEKIFFERQMAVEFPLEYLRPRSIFKIPRPMALLAPEMVADVPRRMRVVAADGDDRVECRSECYDLAQVLIPSEAQLGVTIFNEATARTTVEGCVHGERFSYTGKSTLEFIRVY